MKRRSSVLSVVAVLAMWGCGTGYVRGKGYEGVIFPGREWPYGCSGQVEGYWMPERSQIGRLEARLLEHLRRSTPTRAPKLWGNLGRYKRQYFGVIVDDRQVICASFISLSALSEMEARDQELMGYDFDWRKEAIEVWDRGDDFFEVEYDVEADVIREVWLQDGQEARQSWGSRACCSLT